VGSGSSKLAGCKRVMAVSCTHAEAGHGTKACKQRRRQAQHGRVVPTLPAQVIAAARAPHHLLNRMTAVQQAVQGGRAVLR